VSIESVDYKNVSPGRIINAIENVNRRSAIGFCMDDATKCSSERVSVGRDLYWSAHSTKKLRTMRVTTNGSLSLSSPSGVFTPPSRHTDSDHSWKKYMQLL
jgi:hypothetical protein